MATWPATLPAPALSSLQESPPDNLIRSAMDKGPAKLRRRTTANIRPISFTLMLTPAQVDVLDIFYDVTTFSGVDEFDYTHPRTGNPVTARFADRPQYQEREKVVYAVAVSLEILP